MLLRSLVAVVAGALLACGFEPVGYAPLLVAGVAAFTAAVAHTSCRRSAVLGLLFGLSYFGVLLWWVTAVASEGWAAVSIAEALYFVPLGVATAAVTRLRWWPLWTTAVWIAIETWRSSWPFGGLAWGRVGFASIDTAWSPLLPWLGVTGVGATVVLTGGMVAWLVHGGWRDRGSAVAAVTLTGALTVLPTLIPQLAQHTQQSGTLDVAAIQPGVPGDGTNVLAHHREVTDTAATMTRQLSDNPPDVVLWPENSTAVDPLRDAEAGAAIRASQAASGAPIIVGGMVDSEDPSEVYNQSIVWEADGEPGDRYTKRHPVPYGEYIPMRGVIVPDTYGRLSEIPRDMVPGTPRPPLEIAGTEVAAAICFDVSYDDVIPSQVRDGAQWISVQTSNALFIHTPQIQQQFEITRIRALESGRSVVVASINGVSAIVAPDGSVQETAAPLVAATVRGDVVLTSGLTPAMRLGPWLGRLAVIVALLALLRSVATYSRPHRRTRHGSNAEEAA